MVAGRVPDEWPAGLAFYERALAGDTDGALTVLTGGDPVTAANRLVLDPSEEGYVALRDHATILGDPALSAHVALLGFALGLEDQPPDPDAADGEFAAMAHAGHATLALARHDTAAAVERLEAASLAADPVSRALSGQLMGQLAHAQLDEGGTKRAAVTFQAALDALAGTDLAVSRAELHVAAGAMFQEMSEAAPRLMQQAINHYHQAMALVNAETAPETFAIANANLGLAYLSMPMTEASDQLRVGVAVQSMRDQIIRSGRFSNASRDRFP